MTGLAAIVMPKWGLSMTEGKVTAWLKAPGEIFDEGEDLVEIETSKIVNVYEAPFGSRLCRIVVGEDETVSVGALIAVASTGPASEDDIDAFVATHQNALADEDQSEQEPGGLALGFLQIGSMNLRYGISGDLSKGTPAVLIHGFSSDLNNWLFNVDAIRERAPVVLLELPGHGASSKAIETGDVSELASALDKMLGELGIERAILIGHSLGASVAMQLAAVNPGLAASLLLLAPACLPGATLNQEFIDGVVEAQSARQLLPILKMLFQHPEQVTREMADDMMKFKRIDGADEALAKIGQHLLNGSCAAELEPVLQKLSNVTVVLGTDDQVVGPPDRSRLPESWRVVEVESGHMPHMEAAAETNRIIEETIMGGAAK